MNTVFYPLFVKADAFYSTDECIGCGLCEKLCPLKNIQIKDHRPVWGKECTHCMACIAKCPKKAIEYERKAGERIDIILTRYNLIVYRLFNKIVMV